MLHITGKPLPPIPGAPNGYWARLRWYEERMKAKPLPPADMTAYNEAKAERERRMAALLAAEQQLDATREQRRMAALQAALAAFPTVSVDPAAQQEFDQHAQRIARLERLREVAEADARDDLFARIDGIVQRENQRHDAWVAAHRH
jgi:hypothetical protein